MKELLRIWTLTCILTAIGIINAYGQNLIDNTSFEDSLGNPSLTGWDLGWDTSSIMYSNDVPPTGGSWSVKLKCSYSASSYMIWHLTGIQGTYIYNLTSWTKFTTNFFSFYPPYIGIGIKTNSTIIWRPDSILKQSTIYVHDSIINNWQQITLLDTITSSAQDTIAIILYGGFFTTPGEFSFAFFDLLELTATDTLTSTQNTISFQKPDIRIFPNPSDGKFTIYGLQFKIYTMVIYNVLGEIVFKQTVNQKQETISHYSLPQGMYFYQIINYNNRELLGQGKLIIE